MVLKVGNISGKKELRRKENMIIIFFLICCRKCTLASAQEISLCMSI